MKYFCIGIFLFFIAQFSFAQNLTPDLTIGQKGKLYFYWGWNRGWYNHSDITFSGSNYKFTLKEVVANDRQTPFAIDPYLNPVMITVPQYNFRVGYFIKHNWNISLGVDHMKYVVQQNQTVSISGYIHDSQTEFDGEYYNDDIAISEDFLQFEHTDGLNYLNVELRREDPIFHFNKIDFNVTEGFGLGALLPRTNTTLLNKERYDEFHLAGYGLGVMAGLKVSFFEAFFIQSELKGGFINMADIRTTMFKVDEANQHFFFSEFNIVFGGTVNLSKEHKKKKG